MLIGYPAERDLRRPAFYHHGDILRYGFSDLSLTDGVEGYVK
jgi:hypothetical protein